MYGGLLEIALSHKDWELPNSRIWLAALDIYSGLDLVVINQVGGLCGRSVHTTEVKIQVPFQTDQSRLIRCLWYGANKKCYELNWILAKFARPRQAFVSLYC